MSETKKLRDLKLPIPAGHLGNIVGFQAPIHKPKEMSAVRNIVTSWSGRTLRIQPTGDLQRAMQGLAAYEEKLSDYSPGATRLLASLREELAKPHRQNA